MSQNIRAWIGAARREFTRLGRRDAIAAALAVAMLAATAWLALVAVPAKRAELAAAADAAASARKTALRASVQRVARAAPTGDAFIASFPDASARAQRIARLVQLAEQHGLAWKRGEFTNTNLPSLALSRYQVNLPLSGRYENLRAFVADALDGDQAMSLDEWRLRRPDTSSGAVQAELRFTLFSRAEAAAKERTP